MEIFAVSAGRGSAWLERLVRDQEVPGSNPGAPILIRLIRLIRHEELCCDFTDRAV